MRQGDKISEEHIDQGYAQPVNVLFQKLQKYKISKIGIRVVHGGGQFVEPTRIDEDVLGKLEELSDLAPLHNPPAIKLMREFMLYARVPMYAVFDTAFHAKMPKKAHLYALPQRFKKEYGIRRYGFHGTSHKYVSSVLYDLEQDMHRVISIHLGGGASMTAIKDGKSVETSMGFTPLGGLIMATRA